jgi:hypothetical protein
MTYQLEKQSGVIVKNESMCKKGSSTTVIIEVATLYAQGVTYFSHELMKLDPQVAVSLEISSWIHGAINTCGRKGIVAISQSFLRYSCTSIPSLSSYTLLCTIDKSIPNLNRRQCIYSDLEWRVKRDKNLGSCVKVKKKYVWLCNLQHLRAVVTRFEVVQLAIHVHSK